jgi:uncharacterized protein YndB with AHSA1/START domain
MNTSQSIKEAGTVTMERSYNAPKERVWQALTNVENLRKWFFDVSGFEPKLGFKFEFSGDCGDDINDEHYVHYCEVTDLIEGEKLTYSWSYKDYEGMSYVTWQLFNQGEGTRVVLTHRGLDTFPKLANFTRDSFTGGWTYFMDEALKEFVEK